MKPASEVTLELFRAGTWNGWTFTTADLDRLIANAEALQPYIKPRLVLGHTKRSEQPEVGRMEQPCVGQLKPGSLRRVEKKLQGTFTHVPDVVKQAMAEKLYPPSSVSIEAYPEFRDTRIARELEANVPGLIAPSGPVLCAAAVLGASSLPAVKTLSDLRAYLSENHDATWMSETLAERVAVAEKRFAELRGQRAELERRLARLRQPIATFAQERTSSTMSTNQNQSFRDRVDAAIAAENGFTTAATRSTERVRSGAVSGQGSRFGRYSGPSSKAASSSLTARRPWWEFRARTGRCGWVGPNRGAAPIKLLEVVDEIRPVRHRRHRRHRLGDVAGARRYWCALHQRQAERPVEATRQRRVQRREGDSDWFVRRGHTSVQWHQRANRLGVGNNEWNGEWQREPHRRVQRERALYGSGRPHMQH